MNQVCHYNTHTLTHTHTPVSLGVNPVKIQTAAELGLPARRHWGADYRLKTPVGTAVSTKTAHTHTHTFQLHPPRLKRPELQLGLTRTVIKWGWKISKTNLTELIQKCVFKCVCPFKATVETQAGAAFQTPCRGPPLVGISTELRDQNLELVSESGCRRGSSVLSLSWEETLLASLANTFPW